MPWFDASSGITSTTRLCVGASRVAGTFRSSVVQGVDALRCSRHVQVAIPAPLDGDASQRSLRRPAHHSTGPRVELGTVAWACEYRSGVLDGAPLVGTDSVEGDEMSSGRLDDVSWVTGGRVVKPSGASDRDV